jgi:hypothetical protein
MSQKFVIELSKGMRATSAQELAAALRPVLASQHGIELVSLEGDVSSGVVRGRAKAWVPLQRKELGALEGVHVSLPVDLEIRLERGRATVTAADPATTDLSEAASFVAGLAARGEVDTTPSKTPAAGVTHRVELDAQGRRLLKRARFSGLKL